MPVQFRITLENDKALQRVLKMVAGPVKDRATRKSMTQAAKPVVKAVKGQIQALGLIKTGRLLKSIKSRAIKRNRKGIIGRNVKVGTRQELGISPNAKGFYPSALEYGEKKGRRAGKVKPKPFMRRGLQLSEATARRVFATTFPKFLSQEVEKARRKAKLK